MYNILFTGPCLIGTLGLKLTQIYNKKMFLVLCLFVFFCRQKWRQVYLSMEFEMAQGFPFQAATGNFGRL